MKKQVCSSLLALTMTLGTVTPALAAETENNVQSAACTCTAACTEETRNMDCAVCGAEGAPLTDGFSDFAPQPAQTSSAAARRHASIRFKTEPSCYVWFTFMIHALQRIVKSTAACYNENKKF